MPLPVFVSLSPPLIPAPQIFCYGFGSCLRLGLTYITLINKGCTASRMSHYGISPGHPAPPALIESHQSPHLSSGWLEAQARCLAYLFSRPRILSADVSGAHRLKSWPFLSEHKPGGSPSMHKPTPPRAALQLYLHRHCFFFCLEVKSSQELFNCSINQVIFLPERWWFSVGVWRLSAPLEEMLTVLPALIPNNLHSRRSTCFIL